jgi:DNA-binding response OmpR family regulator
VDEKKPTILIVEDDLDIADMLNSYFRVQGYDILTVNWGDDGVRACISHHPDLMILDIRLPDIDGFEVARRVRSNRRTQNIPIIFLTEKRERGDRLRGLELKADDYITKPFDIQELRLRVRNVLQRSKQETLTNPVTGLPDGSLVEERLAQCPGNKNCAVSVISLKNCDLFREAYGFVALDDLLRGVVQMLQDELQAEIDQGDFLGQLSQTDFILVGDRSGLQVLKEKIQNRLEQSFDYFYRDQDRSSEVFQGQRLSVKIIELMPGAAGNWDLQQIKQELEKLRR